MLNLSSFFDQGVHSTLRVKPGINWSYKGQWVQVFDDTEIDRWYVGDFSSASYQITVEYNSNKKEILNVLVVARPSEASIVIYGRVSIDDELITLTATVNDSYLSLKASPTIETFAGAKLIFLATYAQTVNDLTVAEALTYVVTQEDTPGGGSGSGGSGTAATSFSQLSGTIGLSQISNGLITPVKLNLNASLIPTANETLDLGSNTFRWRDLYLSGSSIQLGSATITASGSSIVLPVGTTVGGTAINSFSTVAVSGQSNVVADSASDTLTLVAGPGIALTTNAGTDTVTITNTGSGGGGASGVSSGTATRLAYYSSTGSVVQDSGANLTWNGTTLAVTGNITASGAVSYVRAYFDTLAELTAVNAATWHGMVAHVHETSRMYFAHAGAWTPLSNYSDLNSFKTIAVAGRTSVVASTATDTLTLVAGTNITITTNASTDTITISAAGGGTSSNSFSTISVAGQSDILADSATDTLTLVAGTNVAIATNGTTDTITISSASSLDGLTDVVIATPSIGQVLKYNGSAWINDADATAGGAGVGTVTTVSVASANGFAGTVATASSTPAITITTSVTGVLKGNATAISAAVAGTDYQAPITFTTTGSSGAATFNGTALNIPQYTSGATAFSGLSDATSAGITVDEIYLQATTRLTVTANGSSAYLFDQYTGNNPTIHATSGTTIAFDLGAGALSIHPFLIRLSGANYDTGLTHVTSAGVVTTGSSAQGKTSGTLYWKIPADISGTYGYLCSNHGTMAGVIAIQSPTSPSFTGTVTVQQLTEVLNTKTAATGTVTHDLSTGAIFYHSSISANFTANFTNVPTTNDRTLAVVLVLSQGATGYYPSAVQIAGVAQTIFWQGALLPAGTANRVDIVSFTLIRTGSAWTVIGALTTYGAP